LKQAKEKIEQLRRMKPDLHISVDGGVNIDNAPELIRAGANVLVVGGGVFKAHNKNDAIRALKDCANVGGTGSSGNRPPL
jgi:ribulose-phosphate 3-epimerase